MNRIMRSRLSIIAVVLIAPMVLVGCINNCELCGLVCSPFMVIPWFVGIVFCVQFLCPCCMGGPCPVSLTQLCEENPEECSATFEQLQITAIQFCEEYPDECQEVFDTWVESLDEEATE